MVFHYAVVPSVSAGLRRANLILLGRCEAYNLVGALRMRTMRYLAIILLVTAWTASAVYGQVYPGDRTYDPNRTTRPTPTNPNNVVKTTGPAQAPDPQNTTQELPENQQPVPPSDSTDDQPPITDDPAFANAMRKANDNIVRINMPPDGRRALGFLINGPDPEHKLVVTNFYAIAREDFTKGFWLDVRTADWSKLEVEGVHVCDELQDLAIIRVKVTPGRKTEILELAKDNPKAKDKVYAIGYRRALVDWAGRGVVEKIEEGAGVGATPGSQWIRTDDIITANNVGGPLLNSDGRVVGLCTSYGRKGRGPYLSVPVSRIHELLGREAFASGRFPGAEGTFRWPESKDTEKQQVYSKDRIMTAATAIKRSLDCKTCNGFGYMVTPEYQVDRTTGRKTKTGERRDVCTDCGGAGVVIKPSLQDLLSTVTLYLLNPDDKVDEPTMAKIAAAAREGFDRAAVNRLVLADALTPSADRLLGEPDKNIGQAVTFLATPGPVISDKDRHFQWVKPYQSEKWLLTYGADIRSVAGTSVAVPPGPPPGDPRRGGPRQPQQRTRSAYVLVSGVIKGEATLESNKQIFQAPLLKVSDIVNLRQ